MNIVSDISLFPYIEGFMLTAQSMEVEVRGVVVEKIALPGREAKGKFVVSFCETDKTLIVSSKTIAKQLVDLLGKETDNWAGGRVVLYMDEVEAFGEIHQVVRVRGVK